MFPMVLMVRNRSASRSANSRSSRDDRWSLSMANSSEEALPKSSSTAVARTPCGRSVCRNSTNPCRMRDQVIFASLTSFTKVTKTTNMPSLE